MERASVSIINENVHKSVKKGNTFKLKPARLRLKSYTGEEITILGVTYKGKSFELPIIVVKRQGAR